MLTPSFKIAHEVAMSKKCKYMYVAVYGLILRSIFRQIGAEAIEYENVWFIGITFRADTTALCILNTTKDFFYLKSYKKYTFFSGFCFPKMFEIDFQRVSSKSLGVTKSCGFSGCRAWIQKHQ